MLVWFESLRIVVVYLHRCTCYFAGFLTNTTTPPQAVWAYSSDCSLIGPLTFATNIHRSPPCWLASSKRPTSSVLASNNRERSQTAQSWTSPCIAASNGSSFLATHRKNGYALRASHLMMMMISITLSIGDRPLHSQRLIWCWSLYICVHLYIGFCILYSFNDFDTVEFFGRRMGDLA